MQRILPALAETGCVSAFFLHFRTVREQYRPVSGHEERFEAGLRLAAPVPVVLNGDIDSPDDASELLERTGAAGVMCARGWLRDPLLLNRIRQGRRDNSGLPSADEARHRLFRCVLEQGFKVCRAIELSNFLWGSANPFFERLKQLPPTAAVSRIDL